MSKLRTRLTYANVMATIAVFIALGGSSYAAVKVTSRDVPKDALTGADIKNLTGRDVKNNSLTGADVKKLGSGDVSNGRLLAEDFAAGQLPRGEKGERGETGSAGPAAGSMLMGTITSTATKEIGTLTNSFSPLGLATGGGDLMLSPNHPIVLRDLAVRVTTAPGADRSRTFFIGAADSLPPNPAISCTLSGSETACNSGEQTATVAPGSYMSFAIQNGTLAPADTDVQYGYRATTP